MLNLVKTLFKAQTKNTGKRVEVTRENSTSKANPKKYDELILSSNHSNYGIEVKEISIVEFDRRKKPRHP